MKTILQNSILTSLIIILSATGLHATNYYSISDGKWSVNSTWSTISHSGAAATSSPGSGDAVFIKGHTVTIQDFHEDCASLGIYGSGADHGLLEISNSKDLDVSGDVLISSDGGSKEARLYIREGSVMTVDGNMHAIKDGGSAEVEIRIYDASLLEVTGDMTAEVDGGTMDLYILCYNTAQITVTGNMTLQHTDGINDIFIDLFDDNRFTISGNLIMDHQAGSGKIDFDLWSTSDLDVDGDIDYSAAAADKIMLTAFDASFLYLGGAFTKDPAPNDYGILDMNTNTTLIYNGSSPQSVAGEDGAGTDGFTFGNVLFQNTSPTPPQMVLTGDIIVNDLFLLDGVLELGEFDLTITENGHIYGASSTAYIDVDIDNGGSIIKLFDGPEVFQFPIGTGDEYTPFLFTLNSADFSGDDYISVKIADDRHGAMKPGDLIERYWVVNSGGFTALDYDVEFKYVEADIDGNESSLLGSFWDGAKWNQMAAVNMLSNLINGTGLTSLPNGFSFSAGSSGALPINLLSFNASVIDKNVKVAWVTANETENDFFRIERSTDGQIWELIGQVKGAGTTAGTTVYDYLDHSPYTGRSYYRLSQTDFDGMSETFAPVAINIGEGKVSKAWPNPLQPGKEYMIQLGTTGSSDEVSVVIMNLLGSQVYSQVHIANSSGVISCPDLEDKLGTGVYFLTASNAVESHKQKLIITDK